MIWKKKKGKKKKSKLKSKKTDITKKRIETDD